MKSKEAIKPCRNWTTGSCTFGTKCRFAHTTSDGTLVNEPPTPGPCRNWVAQGHCRFGETCHYSHATPPQIPANSGRGLVFNTETEHMSDQEQLWLAQQMGEDEVESPGSYGMSEEEQLWMEQQMAGLSTGEGSKSTLSADEQAWIDANIPDD